MLTNIAIGPYQNQTNFKGFRTKNARALIAVDLDGSLANGNDKDIKRVFDLARKANATVAYVTGRTKDAVKILQKELKKRGITLPTPQFLICNDGQLVYEKKSKNLVLDKAWVQKLQDKTNFKKKTVYDTMARLSQSPRYQMSKEEVQKLYAMPDFGERKKRDKEFLTSKFSYYEYCPSQFNVEFVLSPQIKPKVFERDVKKELAPHGIKPKFTFYLFSKEFTAKSGRDFWLKFNPFRENEKQQTRTLTMSAVQKGDGVDYLRKKLGIPLQEVLTAGDNANDTSLASLTKKGSFFVCVANATEELLQHAQKVHTETIVFAKENGAAGIAEGIQRVLRQFQTRTTDKKARIAS